MENLYQVLGIAENASEEEIKLAYRKLAKKYHPDAHPDDAACEKKFQEINEAYSVLSSPEKRKKYDETNRRAAAAEGPAFRRDSGSRQQDAQTAGVDFEHIHRTFEQFFGFNPGTKDVTDEQKLNPGAKNPLDTTELFERFMGIKR